MERWATNLSTLLVGLSGLVYAAMKYLMTSADPFSVVNHPLQPWLLDVHVLSGPVMIFAVGWIARDHILAKIRARNGNGSRGRGTGLLAVVCLLPMVATGYLIQVFTDETARAVCVWTHLITGSLYLLVFVAHVVVSRVLSSRRRVKVAADGAHDRAALQRVGWPSTSATPRGPS